LIKKALGNKTVFFHPKEIDHGYQNNYNNRETCCKCKARAGSDGSPARAGETPSE
jgi:hypothetical protein